MERSSPTPKGPSRTLRPLIWQRQFGLEAIEGTCPSCISTNIHVDMSTGPRGWQGGHMIHGRHLSQQNLTNHLINMVPICLKCNGNDKKFASNFHYRASIGVISTEEAKNLFDDMLKRLIELQRDPTLMICSGHVKDTKTKIYKPCRRQRFQNTSLCKSCTGVQDRARLKEGARAVKMVDEMIFAAEELLGLIFGVDTQIKNRILELRSTLNILLEGSGDSPEIADQKFECPPLPESPDPSGSCYEDRNLVVNESYFWDVPAFDSDVTRNQLSSACEEVGATLHSYEVTPAFRYIVLSTREQMHRIAALVPWIKYFHKSEIRNKECIFFEENREDTFDPRRHEQTK